MIEPSVEPHTISPIARPRCNVGLTSAAAKRASRFDVFAIPNSVVPTSSSAKLRVTTPTAPSTAPRTARP